MNTLSYYFSFSFVRNAMLVGVMIALCAALFGVPLVLKRYSFIGDGLSHVAFGAMAVAGLMNLYSDLIVILPLTMVAAVFLLRIGQNAKIKGDAAIALISVSALAIGYLLMNLFSNSANVSGDVCSTLFGSASLLTLTGLDVIICLAATVVVILFFALFYHKLFAVTFDEDFIRASAVNTNLYNTVIAIMTAVIIVLSMKLVGTLLISALIIFPALSAMRIFQSFRNVMILAAVLAVFCAVAGMIASILLSTPAGASIVVVNLLVFLVSCVVERIKTK